MAFFPIMTYYNCGMLNMVDNYHVLHISGYELIYKIFITLFMILFIIYFTMVLLPWYEVKMVHISWIPAVHNSIPSTLISAH